jgi:hypothetical protein
MNEPIRLPEPDDHARPLHDSQWEPDEGCIIIKKGDGTPT